MLGWTGYGAVRERLVSLFIFAYCISVKATAGSEEASPILLGIQTQLYWTQQHVVYLDPDVRCHSEHGTLSCQIPPMVIKIE